MKQKYQRNMAFGTGSIVVLAVVCGLILWISNVERSQNTVTISQKDIDRTVRIRTSMTEQPKPVIRHLTTPKPKKQERLELSEHIQVTPDAPDPISVDSAIVFSDKSTPNDSNSVQSYSDLQGDSGTGLYASRFQPEDTLKLLKDTIPCRELFAPEPEYPIIALGKKKEGLVEVIICVDDKGNLALFPKATVEVVRENRRSVEKLVLIDSTNKKQLLTVGKLNRKDQNGKNVEFNYAVKTGQPDDWFFVKKFLDILPKWKYVSATVDGQPVISFYTVRNAYCLSDSCREEYKNFKRYVKDTTLASQKSEITSINH